MCFSGNIPKWSRTRPCFIATFFSIALDYNIKKVQENQARWKLNGAHHLLAYTDDVNLQGDTTDTRKENA
jgi:hypothetical protein